MIYNRKYNMPGLIFLNFKISPVYSSIILFQNLIEGFLPTLLTLSISYFIDSVVKHTNSVTVYKAFLAMITIMAIQFLFALAFSVVHRKLIVDLQRKCEYEGIQRVAALEYRYIESKTEYENTSRILSGISDYIYNSYQMALSVFVLFVRISSVFLIFFKANVWWIGIVIMLLTLPVFWTSYKSGKKVYDFYKINFENALEMNHQTYIMKSRDVVDERTLFGFSDNIEKQWKSLRHSYFNSQMEVNRKVEMQLKIPFVISWIVIGLLMLAMTHSLFFKNITIGLFISMINNMIDLNTRINSTVSPLSTQIAKTRAFICDLNDFVDYDFHDDYLLQPHSANHITFQTLEFVNVSFRYPNTDRYVLDHISFKMESGKSYAFVGKNGSGKSTIIKLLIGLYPDYSGEILLNGRDIKEYNPVDIKTMFGIVFQDYAKYNISLKENIDIGAIHYKNNKEKISENREKAIERTQLKALMERLPNGLNTEIGKMDSTGQDISGGEWQRIAIARLLMSESDVCILDEPTSSIDPILEEYIYNFFSKKAEGEQTSIIIGHRLGVTRQVNEILVINQGKLIEQGTHDALMNNKGTYYDMYTKQKGRYQ